MPVLEQISPELVLIDPELRALAVSEFEHHVFVAPAVPRPTVSVPVPVDAAPYPPLFVSAGLYLGFAIVKMAVEGIALIVVVVTLITLAAVW